MSLIPHGLATAVGSLPHADPEQACRLALAAFAEAPAWPQLPRRSLHESFYVQFAEGLPGFRLDGEHYHVDRAAGREALAEFYERSLAGRAEDYAISPQYAAGLAAFLRAVPAAPRPALIKGQISGPISLGLQLRDEDGRPLLYDEEFADVLARHLQLKARWQEQQLQALGAETLVVVDEPFLASYGSAYIPMAREQVLAGLETVFAGLSGHRGVHCCGNTDWALLLNTSAEVISFDAYNYAEALGLYAEDLRAFLRRGGVIAWGIVPNDTAALAAETADSLLARLLASFDALVARGLSRDDLLAACLITPACGLGTLPEPAAERACWLARDVSEALRARFAAGP
jgi:methionine synthase II (cobalamin-independent)